MHQPDAPPARHDHAASPMLHRRTFLADLGRGAVAIAIVGIAGCSPTSLATGRPTSATDGESAGPASPSGSGATSQPGVPSAPPGSAAGGGTAWTRVNRGFVSAYILARGGEAALVDTGQSGSAAAIESALTGAGLGWDALGHVILTHKHGDHVGSLGAVLERAPGATAYLGAADIAAVSGASLTPLADGDSVFGLSIVGTPGHTPGSVSVYDPLAGVLVAGDALGTDAGVPRLPGAQFTEDMDLAKQSVVKLGGLTFETLLVGHGDPIESAASSLVAELGAAG